MGFKDLKKRSQDNISRLTDELNKMNKGAESYKDDRIWKPELDQASNGFAVIRFLPPVEGEDVPWVRIFSHGFQGKGGWFIENCPTTIGGKCPLCESNGELWNSGVEDDKNVARDRKRKLSYFSNILVVSDPKNPQNEGKVFLFKYGKKIFDKIMEKIQPEFVDESPVNVFDFWKGADFKLKIRKVAGYVNYDKSEFDTPQPVLGGVDKKLEELWSKQYKLQDFLKPENFKTYEELSAKLNGVLNGSSKKKAEDVEGEDFIAFDKKVETKSVSPKSTKMPEKKMDEDVEEEDAMSYFEKLTNDE
jgi:hypothetical protein